MRIVKRVQYHRATVKQTDWFLLDDATYTAYKEAEEDKEWEREELLLRESTVSYDDELEVEDIHETTEVELTADPPTDEVPRELWEAMRAEPHITESVPSLGDGGRPCTLAWDFHDWFDLSDEGNHKLVKELREGKRKDPTLYSDNIQFDTEYGCFFAYGTREELEQLLAVIKKAAKR